MRIIPAIAVLMTAFSITASAEIKVKVNERTVAMDTSPYIANNHTMVPVRGIAEILGCDVEWIAKDRRVIIEDGENSVKLTIDKNSAEVNGKTVMLDLAAVIKNNRTYVPLRFVAESLDAEVDWNSVEKTVEITKDGVTTDISYDEDELIWLARIIHAEAEGEPFNGKLAVGNVVLNRVDSSEFPDTIYGVIFDRKNGVQFTPVANGRIYNTPSNESIYAADRALEGENVIDKALFFCNPVTSTSSWIMNNRELYSVIGKHNFYM